LDIKNNSTVLIVEDKPTIADMQSKKLKEAGFNVDIAHCGKEAIKRLNNNHMFISIFSCF
jgi:DNA-binding response OmpR family regulator